MTDSREGLKVSAFMLSLLRPTVPALELEFDGWLSGNEDVVDGRCVSDGSDTETVNEADLGMVLWPSPRPKHCPTIAAISAYRNAEQNDTQASPRR